MEEIKFGSYYEDDNMKFYRILILSFNVCLLLWSVFFNNFQLKKFKLMFFIYFFIVLKSYYKKHIKNIILIYFN